MDKKDLERRLEAAEKQNLGLLDEIKNLKAKLAEVQDKPEIPDFPIFKPLGEAAWHLNNVLDISTPGITRGTVCDFNYFHTEEYAKEFAQKCKLIAMMLHCKWYLDRDYHPDFNNGWAEKWTVNFNHSEGKFTVALSKMREWSAIYFGTEENAQKCANWLNAHWKEV